MDVYKTLLRPLLFKLDPELAHNVAKAVLQRPLLGRLFGGKAKFVQDERLTVYLNELKIPNPVGLGAGFDKDGDMLNSLAHFGFGYLVAGSVMCDPRPGNPRPRMVRDTEREALFSCMGLPSKGLGHAVKRIKGSRLGHVPLFVNFNGVGLDDYLKCIEALQSLGDALEIVLFCPNRPQDTGDFLSPRVAEKLLTEISKRKKKPVFIKIPGYRSEYERVKRMDLVEHILKYPIDGISITPESVVDDKRLSVGRGTLTGRPMFEQMLNVVRDVYLITKGNYHIKASGGIFTAEDAYEAIAAGASLVEIMTGFMYEGWDMARKINQGLINLLDRDNIQNVATLRGTNV
ncbi:dihydroorotate dehydrogenase 2 [Thermodesulfobacteriota bacterium]